VAPEGRKVGSLKRGRVLLQGAAVRVLLRWVLVPLRSDITDIPEIQVGSSMIILFFPSCHDVGLIEHGEFDRSSPPKGNVY